MRVNKKQHIQILDKLGLTLKEKREIKTITQ